MIKELLCYLAFLLVDFLFPCQKGVLHQRANGHWTNATRNWSDEAALRRYVFEVNVASQLETGLRFGAWNTGGTYVDNNGTVFYHVGCDELRRSHSRDNDVGFFTDFLNVLCSAVTYGYGCVAWVGLLHHK